MNNNSQTSSNTNVLGNVAMAASILGVSERTVYRMIEDGEIRAVKVRGALRIPIAPLLAQFGLGEVADA